MKRALFCFLFALLVSGCASPKYSNDVRSTELVKSSTSWNAAPLPAYPTGTPEVTILRITVPPGHTLPMHRHPVINAGVLLEGQLTVVTESGEVLELSANDPIIEVVNTWHYGKNEGDEPAEIIVFYAGEKGGTITVKKQEINP